LPGQHTEPDDELDSAKDQDRPSPRHDGAEDQMAVEVVGVGNGDDCIDEV
jgi:hypothetical protein